MSRCGECRTELDRENKETAHLYERVEKLEAAVRTAVRAILYGTDESQMRATVDTCTKALEGK